MQTCLLLLPLCVLGVGEDPVLLKELGITLPPTLANIKFQGTKQFDMKALGYSVAYGNKMCTISLIVYDLDQKQIPSGKANKPVQEQLERSIQDLQAIEKKGLVKNVVRIKGDLALPKDVVSKFATAGFTFDVQGGGCKSYILLVGHNGYFFKVRVTQYVVDNQTNDADVQAFLTAIAKQLKGPEKK
jgi:hypothetical protein